MYSLKDLGYNSFIDSQVSGQNIESSRLGRISVVHRNSYECITENGTGNVSFPQGSSGDLSSESLPKVGDWVLLESPLNTQDSTPVVKVLDRFSTFKRGASGKETKQQVLVTNIDLVFIVTALDSDFNLNRVERYLSLVWSSGANPVVLLNKADCVSDGIYSLVDVEERNPGVQTLLISALNDENIEQVRGLIPPGITACFVGSSGVGKSTIINSLLGDEILQTGEVRNGDRKGRHTTTHRQLIVLPGGGLVIDTPGMRELQMTGDAELNSAFPEIENLSNKCRFRDCSHNTEPGCAVKAAVESGEIKKERLDNYLKLQKESASFAIRQDEHLRRKSEKIWGKLKKEGDYIRRLKREK